MPVPLAVNPKSKVRAVSTVLAMRKLNHNVPLLTVVFSKAPRLALATDPSKLKLPTVDGARVALLERLETRIVAVLAPDHVPGAPVSPVPVTVAPTAKLPEE
jgi:hypothetical protein